MGSPIASYFFANFSRAATFGILFVFSRFLSSEDMANIFLSKNVSNAIVLSCSFGVHISYLRDKTIESIRASVSLLMAVVLFEIFLATVQLADWSLIFFTLTAYYGLVLPSLPQAIVTNVVGIIVSIAVAVIVIFFNVISLELLFITGSVVLLIPLCYRIQFRSVRDLIQENRELFIGELAPFVFGLFFVPSMLWFNGVEIVNTYGRIMMFVNIVLFPVNGLKYVLISRLESGENIRLLSYMYIGVGIIGGSCLYLLKELFGELNDLVITRYLWQIVILITARILSDLFQQKSYVRSTDKSRNIIIYIGYFLRFSTLLIPSMNLFVLALCVIEVLCFILFYVLDIYYSDNRNHLSI